MIATRRALRGVGVAAVLVATGAGAGSPGAQAGVRLDAVVTASSGQKTRLSTRWGKPAVLFYEDKDSVALNQEAKDALARLGRQRGLLQAVEVVAVANLEGFNWQPAIFFALEGVKKEEQKAGVPVYVDLTGELTRAPWGLSGTSSSVLVLSAAGERRFTATGKLSKAQLEAMLAALQAELSR
jgi:hypothetical protein